MFILSLNVLLDIQYIYEYLFAMVLPRCVHVADIQPISRSLYLVYSWQNPVQWKGGGIYKIKSKWMKNKHDFMMVKGSVYLVAIPGQTNVNKVHTDWNGYKCESVCGWVCA